MTIAKEIQNYCIRTITEGLLVLLVSCFLIETYSLQTTYSNIYLFLHSTTKQKINRYMGSVNLLPINILEKF